MSMMYTIVQSFLIIAKLLNNIDISWYKVFIPTYIYFALIGVLTILAIIIDIMEDR